MGRIDITTLSSRGQVVIPLKLRKRLKLAEGEKFIILGENNTIVLRKIEMPSFTNFDKLVKKTQEFEKNLSSKQADLDEALKKEEK